ncbi:hypothetical protein SprV_0301351600 [Sparganum proliferum]
MKAPWCWSSDCEKAFVQLKLMLSSDLLLTNYDLTLPIVVTADASNHGVGAAISYNFLDGSEKTIMHAARAIPPTEKDNRHIKSSSSSRVFREPRTPAHTGGNGQFLHAINFTFPEFWQHAPELYFIRIESTFYSASVTKELAKYHKVVEVLPASVISQVQSLLSNPPADAPYSTLKAEILRLNCVSDRHRHHQLLKEESLGDRKPSDLLRRMRSLLGDMQVDDKFVKEMFLERLPADVQTILTSGSQDLTVSQLAEMADRMIEVQRFQSPSVAQISSSSSVNDQLVRQVSAMANEMASLKIQLARLTPSRSCSRRRSRSLPRTADT